MGWLVLQAKDDVLLEPEAGFGGQSVPEAGAEAG